MEKSKRMELIAEWENRVTMKILAKKYGVTPGAVNMILHRWRKAKRKS